jgi:hypothetical protein
VTLPALLAVGQIDDGRRLWVTPGRPEVCVRGGELLAEDGDFAAELLVAAMRGF